MYENPPPADKIVKEARKIMQNQRCRFSLLKYNCEHFANDASIGQDRSPQVEELASTFIDVVAGAVKGHKEGETAKEVFEEAAKKVIDYFKHK